MAFELLMIVAFWVVFRKRKIQPFRVIDAVAAAAAVIFVALFRVLESKKSLLLIHAHKLT